jgi:polysaccharide export outer membrane protein
MRFAAARAIALILVGALAPSFASGQSRTRTGAETPAAVPPAGYVIGAEDVLAIVFWRDQELSAEVVVRPDGKISLPLLNDIDAAGYTPEQLRAVVEKAAAKYVSDPNATVIVKAINSRKVHIVGNVGKPGTYSLAGELNVLQFIAMAGGLLEFADAKNVTILRRETGGDRYYKFNYKDVVRQKNVEQNIQLKPGDTVIVR